MADMKNSLMKSDNPQAGSLAFTPPGDEMSEVITTSRCLPHRTTCPRSLRSGLRKIRTRDPPRLQGTEHPPTPPRPIIEHDTQGIRRGWGLAAEEEEIMRIMKNVLNRVKNIKKNK